MSQVHMNSAWTKVHMSQIDKLDLSKFMILGSNGSWTVHGQPYSAIYWTNLNGRTPGTWPTTRCRRITIMMEEWRG